MPERIRPFFVSSLPPFLPPPYHPSISVPSFPVSKTKKKFNNIRVVAINHTVHNGDLAARDLEDTDLSDIDGLSGVAQEQDVASCKCGFHTLTSFRREGELVSSFLFLLKEVSISSRYFFYLRTTTRGDSQFV